MNGLRIKARAVWWQVDGDWLDPNRGAGLDGGSEYPLASLLQDLLPDEADTLKGLLDRQWDDAA
jgi:hypothetical protein